MTKPSLSAYDKLSFEEATRIIYYHFANRKDLFMEFMEDLMNNDDAPHEVITPRQHRDYRDFLNENKKSK